MKSGNLNFLEPSGTVQACNGTALPFPLQLITGLVLGAANGWWYELLHFLAKKGHLFLLLETCSKRGVEMLRTGNQQSHRKRAQ